MSENTVSKDTRRALLESTPTKGKEGLLAIAKEYNIAGRHDMHKDMLIDAILGVENVIGSLSEQQRAFAEKYPDVMKQHVDKAVDEVNKKHEAPLPIDTAEPTQEKQEDDEEMSWLTEVNEKVQEHGVENLPETISEEIAWLQEAAEVESEPACETLVQESAAQESAKSEDDSNAETVSAHDEQRSGKGNQGFTSPSPVKLRYLNVVEPGTIVAFRNQYGRVVSAAVKHRNTARQKLMVETAYGAEFIIDFVDVVWVRVGKRWPRGVYNLLREGGKNGKKQTESTNG